MGTATELVQEGTARYNKGDVEGFCALYSGDVVLVTPDGRFEGREAARAAVQAMLDPMPDTEVSVGRHTEDGDLYFGEWTLRGTNTGALTMPDGSALPATGRAVEMKGAEIVRVADGAIVEHELFWDNMALMAQLGLVPAG